MMISSERQASQNLQSSVGCASKPTLHRIRVHQTCLLEMKVTAGEYGEVAEGRKIVKSIDAIAAQCKQAR
jgi:hypothetical protein